MSERPLTFQEKNRALKVYLKDRTWFRVLKSIYIGAWVLCSLFVAVIALYDYEKHDYLILLVGNVMIWMVFSLIDLGFYFYMRTFYRESSS